MPAGPGDDCAVLPPSRERLCVTTDAVVEDVHFTRDHFTPEDIGYKALAVNLSDLAAMGATPRWFVCALALPPAFPAREVVRLGKGMAGLARAHRIALVGGNVTSARELSITITAAGGVKGAPLRRGGGRPGDWLYVSGTLGEARLGLEELQRSPGLGARSRFASRQRRPVPRVRLGGIAARYASAGMDLSDGLAQDLGHLCEASGTGAEVELARLPVAPEVRAALGTRGALAGGEDYELLLAVRPARGGAFERACRRAKERVTRVGQLTSERARVFRDREGAVIPPPAGFDHRRPQD